MVTALSVGFIRSTTSFQVAAKALAQLPEGASIDLALIHVSSIYGNAERLEMVVPELRKAVPGLGAVVGCSSAGAVGMQSTGGVVEVTNDVCVGHVGVLWMGGPRGLPLVLLFP